MKKIILSLSVLILAFSSCTKNQPETTQQTSVRKKIESGNSLKLAIPSNLDDIRVHADSVHNTYMAATLNAYNTNTLSSSSYTLTNLGTHIDWAENYFNDLYADDLSLIWADLRTSNIAYFNSGLLGLTNRKLRFDNTSTSSFKGYQEAIITNIVSILNGNVIIDFPTECGSIYAAMKLDQSLNTNEKEILAAIIGVAEGSYSYWDVNIDYWPQLHIPDLSNSENEGGYPVQALSNRRKKIIGFLLADVMGAMDGAAAGSVLPLVGTAAGAVAGGALTSGMTAAFW